MKRFWIALAILVVALALLVSACGSGDQTTTTGAATTGAPTTAPPTTGAPTTGAPTTAGNNGAKPVVAVCLPAMDNPLMLEIKDTFVKNFGADYDVQVSSADGNPNTQSTQVENYTAMKVKLLCVMAVEATSLLPKLEAARKAGILTLVIGGEPGASGRDAVMKMDQYLGGAYCAWMGKQWVEATFPNAAPGSIETGVLTSQLTTEAIQRTSGLLMISEPYLKDLTGAYVDGKGTPISDEKGAYLAGKSDADRVANPVYCAAVKIVQKADGEMFQAGQTTMQNFLTQSPNIQLVLAYASDGGNGASQAIMDEFGKGSGSVVKDLSKIAVFGVGMFGTEGDAIKASAQGKSVFRGAIAFGGTDLPGKTAALVKKMLAGEQYPEITWDELACATAGPNGDLVIKPMVNQGVITVSK
jgi:ABC-type sugar transport system substrate-binding protein